jgi:putative ABC transport system permease protein
MNSMDRLTNDIRFAFRSFRRAPAVALVAISLLAVGIGLTTAVFSVVEGLVLRSLPFREPERLVAIGQVPVKSRLVGRAGATSSARAVEIARQSPLFEGVTAFLGRPRVLSGLGDVRNVSAWSVRSDFFRVLGAQPVIGRAFSTDEDVQGSAVAAIVSDAFWRGPLGGDPNVLGRTLTLDGAKVPIVGVMSSAFRYPAGAELWLSFGGITPSPPSNSIQGAYHIVARLAPGVTIPRVEREMDVVYARVAEEVPAFRDWGPAVLPLRDRLVGSVRRPLLVAFGGVALVLLVACANVANLLLARSVARRREVAIRLALGATRGRVVRQLLTESVALALAGAVLGTLMAWLGVPWLLALGAKELPDVGRIGVDRTVLLFALAAATATGILFGIAPALQAVRGRLTAALHDGGSGAGASAWRSRLGDALVVVQVAVTIVLLAGGALLAGSFQKLMSVPVGFDADRVVVATVWLRGERYDSAASRRAFMRGTLERAAAIPGAGSVTAGTGIPLSAGAFGDVTPDEQPSGGPPQAFAVFTGMSDDYLRTFGIPLLRGRAISSADAGNDAILVNDAFARTYYPGKDPIGHQVEYYGRTRGTIVGVVGDTRTMQLGNAADPQLYFPMTRAPERNMHIAVRTSGDPASLGNALRRAIREVDAGLPIDRLQSMRSLMGDSVARQRFYAVLLVVFAAAALVMATAGLYATMSYVVDRRTRELGIRGALGASASELAGMVLRRGLALALAGIVAGVAGAVVATKLLAALLFELAPGDPVILAGVSILLVLTSVAASYLPARRAARVSPMEAIRAE